MDLKLKNRCQVIASGFESQSVGESNPCYQDENLAS
jgi:hypothetical protein